MPPARHRPRPRHRPRRHQHPPRRAAPVMLPTRHRRRSGSPAATTTTDLVGRRRDDATRARTRARTRGSGRSLSSRGSGRLRVSRTSRLRASRTQGQQGQGQRQGNQGESRDGEHHVELSGNAMSDAKKVGSELVGAARDSAVSLLDAQRARAADQITALGDALRRSAESFEFDRRRWAGGVCEPGRRPDFRVRRHGSGPLVERAGRRSRKLWPALPDDLHGVGDEHRFRPRPLPAFVVRADAPGRHESGRAIPAAGSPIRGARQAARAVPPRPERGPNTAAAAFGSSRHGSRCG